MNVERKQSVHSPYRPTGTKLKRSLEEGKLGGAGTGQGVEFVAEADEDATGPAHVTDLDPDDNPILVNQYV